MMNKTCRELIVLGVLTLTVATLSCKGRKKDEGKNGVTIYVPTEKSTAVDLVNDKKTSFMTSELFSKVEFTKLETSTPSLLAGIDDILTFENLYIFLDHKQKSILCFDTTGKYRFKIFPKGKGPLELNNITDYTMNVRNRTIEAFDFTLQKIVCFDLSGHPVKEKKFNFYLREFACTGNGDYIIYAPDLANEKNEFNKLKENVPPGAFLVDSNGIFKSSIVSVKSSGMYIQPLNCLSGYGDSITLASNYFNYAFLINNKKVSAIYNMKAGPNWNDDFIMARACGGSMNLVYKKNDRTYTVYFDLQSGKEKHFDYMLNDLFGLPISIPYFYKDSRTMLYYISAEELPQIKDIIAKLKADKQDGINYANLNKVSDILLSMQETDNPLLVKLQLK